MVMMEVEVGVLVAAQEGAVGALWHREASPVRICSYTTYPEHSTNSSATARDTFPRTRLWLGQATAPNSHSPGGRERAPRRHTSRLPRNEPLLALRSIPFIPSPRSRPGWVMDTLPWVGMGLLSPPQQRYLARGKQPERPETR